MVFDRTFDKNEEDGRAGIYQSLTSRVRAKEKKRQYRVLMTV